MGMGRKMGSLSMVVGMMEGMRIIMEICSKSRKIIHPVPNLKVVT
jgi:hypothetical protein